MDKIGHTHKKVHQRGSYKKQDSRKEGGEVKNILQMMTTGAGERINSHAFSNYPT